MRTEYATPRSEKDEHRDLRRRRTGGYSSIEILVVLAVAISATAAGLYGLSSRRDKFRSDDEATLILEYMREGSRRALAQRQVMRLEVDKTTNSVRLIDEAGTGSSADDTLVRQAKLDNLNYVKYDAKPSNLPSGAAPPAPFNYNAATFATSSHPLSNGDQVWVVRFQPNGGVTDTNGNITSGTLYIWSPQNGSASSTAAQQLNQVRAITVFGGSGSVRLWGYDTTSSTFIPR